MQNLAYVISIVAEWMHTYVIHQWRIFRSGSRNLAWVGFESATTEFCPNALIDWTIKPWDQLALRANFVQLFHPFIHFSYFTSAIAFVSHRICLRRNLAQVITLVAEWVDTYRIHHWRIFKSSYRKLGWVGFEPTTTEFCPYALTDRAIRPWVELALRANFVQLLQFHIFAQCSHSILTSAFVNRHVCFKRNLAQVITLVAEWINTYGIYHWRIFRSSYRKMTWVGF